MNMNDVLQCFDAVKLGRAAMNGIITVFSEPPQLVASTPGIACSNMNRQFHTDGLSGTE
jgi:hypothetical protein